MPLRLLPLLLALLALWGCAPQSMPAPSAVPTPTAAQALSSPSPSPAGVPMPTPARTSAPRPEPLSPLGAVFDETYIPIAVHYTGRDDGLFQAIYQSLCSTDWPDVAAGVQGFASFLPPGQQAQLDFLWGTYSDHYFEAIASAAQPEITQAVLSERGMAYIRLDLSFDSMYLLFYIEESGAFIPVGAKYCNDRTWDVSFVNYCGIPFLVTTYDDVYGTGLLVVRTDWYNLQANQLQICYRSTLISGDQAWSPLGWTQFQGALSEATIQEDDLGFTITMEATSRLYRMIDMENPQFAGTKYDWTRTDPIQIRYDAQTNTAYFLEGKGSWVDRRSGAYSFPHSIYFQPFLEQLQTAAESQDPGALWAQWVLATGSEDGWEAVLEANGMEYEKP